MKTQVCWNKQMKWVLGIFLAVGTFCEREVQADRVHELPQINVQVNPGLNARVNAPLNAPAPSEVALRRENVLVQKKNWQERFWFAMNLYVRKINSEQNLEQLVHDFAHLGLGPIPYFSKWVRPRSMTLERNSIVFMSPIQFSLDQDDLRLLQFLLTRGFPLVSETPEDPQLPAIQDRSAVYQTLLLHPLIDAANRQNLVATRMILEALHDHQLREDLFESSFLTYQGRITLDTARLELPETL